VLLSHIMKEAKKEGKRLRAEFKHTGRNRLMFVTFKFANFKAVSAGNEENMVLENDLSAIKEIPPYIRVIETRSG